MDDLISRREAIDAVNSETVSTNPEHFKSSEKFIKFMDDADIASFGKWQWANGFNTAVVATKIQLEKLPSAKPKMVCVDKITLSDEQIQEAVEKVKNEVVQVLPSAQSENIRCYECKHGIHSGCGDVYICHVSTELVMEHAGDFYCGYAERRTDEQTD